MEWLLYEPDNGVQGGHPEKVPFRLDPAPELFGLLAKPRKCCMADSQELDHKPFHGFRL